MSNIIPLLGRFTSVPVSDPVSRHLGCELHVTDHHRLLAECLAGPRRHHD